MQTLLSNMHDLCDMSRMLSGITVAYGTKDAAEHLSYGRAQEVQLDGGRFVPHVRMIDDQSIYDLASLTKFFTCVMTMMLVEQGRLALNERVGAIDPRFENLKEVSVHDVMCYLVSLQTPGRIDTAPDREEGLRRLFAVKPAPLPPVRIYSDMNAMVVKYIIEARTGMAYADALKQYIFDPLGMRDTYAAVPVSKRSRCLCYNYEHRIVRDAHILRTDTLPGTPHDPKAMLLGDGGRDLCGHAGLFSTRQDMTLFAQALLGGELLKRETLLDIGTNRTGKWNSDGTYRQPLGLLCFTKHPDQHLSEVPAYAAEHAIGLSGFTGNHLIIDIQHGVFEIFLGNRCHNRISHITPPLDKTLTDYGLDDRGAGMIRWPDGRKIATSAKYVYQKDRCLHEPIVQRMQTLGWLR